MIRRSFPAFRPELRRSSACLGSFCAPTVRCAAGRVWLPQLQNTVF